MEKQYLYLIIVLVILVIAVLGWYFFSSTGKMVIGERCTRWKCIDTKIRTCPSGTTYYTCSGGNLYCTNQTHTTVATYTCPPNTIPTFLNGILYCSDRITGLRVATYTCPRYSGPHFENDTLYCWVFSTTTRVYSCSDWYVPSCSGKTLTCSKTSYTCGYKSSGSCQVFSSCSC